MLAAPVISWKKAVGKQYADDRKSRYASEARSTHHASKRRARAGESPRPKASIGLGPQGALAVRLPSREPLLPEGSCVGGRRPLLHLVVLHASEPGVSQYARDLAIKWNWHGFDVFINLHVGDVARLVPPSHPLRRASHSGGKALVKAEHLSGILQVSPADFIVVVGQYNMQRGTGQVRRGGRLHEVPVDDSLTAFLEQWASMIGVPMDIEGVDAGDSSSSSTLKLSEAQLARRLERYTGVRDMPSCIEAVRTQAAGVRGWLRVKGRQEALGRARTADAVAALSPDHQQVLLDLQSMEAQLMRLHARLEHARSQLQSAPRLPPDASRLEVFASSLGLTLGVVLDKLERPTPAVPDRVPDGTWAGHPALPASMADRLLFALSKQQRVVQAEGEAVAALAGSRSGWSRYLKRVREAKVEGKGSLTGSVNGAGAGVAASGDSGGWRGGAMGAFAARTSASPVAGTGLKHGSLQHGKAGAGTFKHAPAGAIASEAASAATPQVELRPGQWYCAACTYVNEPGAKSCLMCQGKRATEPADQSPGSIASPAAGAPVRSSGQLPSSPIVPVSTSGGGIATSARASAGSANPAPGSGKKRRHPRERRGRGQRKEPLDPLLPKSAVNERARARREAAAAAAAEQQAKRTREQEQREAARQEHLMHEQREYLQHQQQQPQFGGMGYPGGPHFAPMPSHFGGPGPALMQPYGFPAGMGQVMGGLPVPGASMGGPGVLQGSGAVPSSGSATAGLGLGAGGGVADAGAVHRPGGTPVGMGLIPGRPLPPAFVPRSQLPAVGVAGLPVPSQGLVSAPARDAGHVAVGVASSTGVAAAAIAGGGTGLPLPASSAVEGASGGWDMHGVGVHIGAGGGLPTPAAWGTVSAPGKHVHEEAKGDSREEPQEAGWGMGGGAGISGAGALWGSDGGVSMGLPTALRESVPVGVAAVDMGAQLDGGDAVGAALVETRDRQALRLAARDLGQGVEGVGSAMDGRDSSAVSGGTEGLLGGDKPNELGLGTLGVSLGGGTIQAGAQGGLGGGALAGAMPPATADGAHAFPLSDVLRDALS